MLVDLLLLAASLVLGLALQRRASRADQLRERLWGVNYVVLIPLAATYAFLGLDLDRELLGIMGCAVTAWWATVALAGLWARLAARSRPERGALWLVAAFPNTGFIGFPLADLAYGAEGLRYAIVYDQVSLLVPAIVVSTMIARRHASDPAATDDIHRSVVRQALASPPLLTVLALVSLRLTLLPEPVEVAWLGALAGAVVGPVGFLLLGLSLPLGGYVHDRRVVVATSGAVLVRIAVAPSLLWLVARLTGVDVPGALFLVAALPTAFHALVVARVHQLEVTLVRLGLVMSTALMVGGTVGWVALGGGAG